VTGLVHGDGPWPNLAAIETSIRLYAGDILDLERLTALLRDARPQRIFHLAGLAATRLSFDDPLGFFRVNALGTATLLEAVWRAGLCDARVLVVSTGEAYGRSAGLDPVPEEAPLRPITPYGASKAAAEAAATASFEGRGLAVVRARAFNHTGARQDADFAPAAFARQIALAEAGLGPREVKVGRLDTVRDFSHVSDVVAAYATLLDRGRPGEVYNVGSGRGTTIAAVLETLIALSSAEIRVVVDPGRKRPADMPHLVADVRRIAALGVRNERTIRDALEALIDSWRRRVRAGL
jgi:GDP-4-dehydro-6-deoxy-D-mannose reductase